MATALSRSNPSRVRAEQARASRSVAEIGAVSRSGTDRQKYWITTFHFRATLTFATTNGKTHLARIASLRWNAGPSELGLPSIAPQPKEFGQCSHQLTTSFLWLTVVRSSFKPHPSLPQRLNYQSSVVECCVKCCVPNSASSFSKTRTPRNPREK